MPYRSSGVCSDEFIQTLKKLQIQKTIGSCEQYYFKGQNREIKTMHLTEGRMHCCLCEDVKTPTESWSFVIDRDQYFRYHGGMAYSPVRHKGNSDPAEVASKSVAMVVVENKKPQTHYDNGEVLPFTSKVRLEPLLVKTGKTFYDATRFSDWVRVRLTEGNAYAQEKLLKSKQALVKFRGIYESNENHEQRFLDGTVCFED